MKVCIDGIIQEVEDTLKEPHFEPPKDINDEMAELKAGLSRLQSLVEPIVKLFGKDKEE